MHLHLPKPLHGWREFLGEVGIIVIGVLIALGAEQLVENWHWQSKAADAQAAIDAELALIGGVLDARTLSAPCEKKALDQVSAIISEARSSGRIGDVGPIIGGGTTPLPSTAWEAALSEGTVSHIREPRRREYAILYHEIGLYREAANDENRLYAHVRLLQHSPGSLSDALLADIAGSNAELASRTRLDRVIAEQALVQMRDLGIAPDYGYLTGAPGTLGHGTRDEVRRDLLKGGFSEPRCKPVLENGDPVIIASAAPGTSSISSKAPKS